MRTSVVVVHGLRCSVVCGNLLDQGLASGLSSTVPLWKSQAPITLTRFQPLDVVGRETQPRAHYEVCEKKAGRKASRKVRKILGESPPFFPLFFGSVFTGGSITGRGSLIVLYQVVLLYKHSPCLAHLSPCPPSRPALGLFLLGLEAEP